MFSICLITTSLVIFIIVCFSLLRTNYLLIKLLFAIIYFTFIISYIYTSLINPGIPRRDYYIPNIIKRKIADKKNWKKCSKCNILIPKNLEVIHCDICKVCVREQDHHCPWTGKCIGKYNLISFYIFVYSLFAYIIMIYISLFTYMYFRSNMIKNKNHKI